MVCRDGEDMICCPVSRQQRCDIQGESLNTWRAAGGDADVHNGINASILPWRWLPSQNYLNRPSKLLKK